LKKLYQFSFLKNHKKSQAIKVCHSCKGRSPGFSKWNLDSRFCGNDKLNSTEKESFIVNSKGISALFLVIAMMLMATIGYVFSYLIPAKQKSVRFPIYSTQAFFITQAGIEYAIRYSSNQGWRSIATLTGLNNPGVNQRTLGNGKFTLSYDNATDTLTSTGEITSSTEKRIVKVSNLTQFLNVLVLWISPPAYPAPCWCLGTRRARFYIKYVGTNSVTLTSFSASWTQNPPPPPVRRLTDIYMDGVQKFSGNYDNGNPATNFNRGGGSQTLIPNQVITVLIYWGANTGGTNIIIKFYTALGDPYTFTLDPAGGGLGNCAVGC
jgi:hypothetical protein